MSFSIENITSVAVLTSAGAVAAGLAFSLAARSIRSRPAAIGQKDKERDYKREVRLSLVREMLENEINRKLVFRLASASLIFSQFVVGGVLASSFAVKALGEPLLGILGLVVLASSLVTQHFRPDLLHKISVEKVRRLKHLARKLDDDLYVATRGAVSDDQLIQIRLYATRILEEIDNSEIVSFRNDSEKFTAKEKVG